MGRDRGLREVRMPVRHWSLACLAVWVHLDCRDYRLARDCAYPCKPFAGLQPFALFGESPHGGIT